MSGCGFVRRVTVLLVPAAVAACVALPPPSRWGVPGSPEPSVAETRSGSAGSVDTGSASPGAESREEPRKSLTWSEAVSTLRRMSPSLLAARRRVERAQALQELAGARAYPRLDVRANWVRFVEAAQFRGRSDSDVSGDANRTRQFTGRGSDIYSAGVDVTYPLLDGGVAYWEARAAERARDASEHGALGVQEELELRSFEIYLELLLLDGAISIAQGSLEFSEREAADARARARAGEALELEARRFDARALQARLVLNRALADRRTRVAVLAELLATSLDPDLELEPITSELARVDGDPYELALESRRELLALRSREAELDARLRAAGSAWWPTLSAFGSYGVIQLDELRLRDTADELTVGAALRWNLFEGGGTEARRGVARAEWLEVVEARRVLELQVRREIASALAELGVAGENVEVSAESEKVSAEVLATVRAQFRAGETRVLDVTEAELDHTTARLAALRSQVELVRSQARLRRAAGLEPIVTADPENPPDPSRSSGRGARAR